MNTRAQDKKDQIIANLIQARQSILNVAASLSSTQQDQVFLGTWCAKDLLAHLVGWDFANIQAVQAVQAGALPDFYAHHDPHWRTFNARLVAQYRQEDFAALLTSVRESLQKLVDVLRQVPARDFNRDTGVRFKGYQVTIARLIEAEAGDEWKHHQQIQEFAARAQE